MANIDPPIPEELAEARQMPKIPTVPVGLERALIPATPDLPLWELIRRNTDSLAFDKYLLFMDFVLCGSGDPPSRSDELGHEFYSLLGRRFLPFNDTDAYRLLKVATEAFVVVNCAVPGELEALKFEDADIADLNYRLQSSLTAPDVRKLWDSYLSSTRINGRLPDDPAQAAAASVKTLLYLSIIRDKLPELRLKSRIFQAFEWPNRRVEEQCIGILREKLTRPCLLELIWSYWHEEGMLVQTMNAIGRRFQNIRAPGARDPLAFMEIDPLRPLNNVLWGYIQDEQHRLTITRRAYEYDHHYGLSLRGKAVPPLRPADSRSKFLEGFHNLLYLCGIFYKEDDDTTVKADGFPVLNALKDVHILLSEGAHNQFGDLPATARQEMLVQQWVLARPEFREFLPTRVMVALPEKWMDRVDAMKHIQGWSDVTVLHFHNLGAFGEQLLLSVRFGAWTKVNDSNHAANWARFWRAEVQGYVHAYRAVTGVDLTAEITDSRQAADRYLQPSVHLSNRLARQGRNRGACAGPSLPVTNLRGGRPAPRPTS